MPLLLILGLLVVIIGVVIFTVNKRESDRFIEEQLTEKNKHKKEAENLHTFNSNPKHKSEE